MAYLLPPELWIQVFQFALEEFNVLKGEIPNSLSPSWWSKGYGNKWILRTPLDATTVAHRRRNTLLKVRLRDDLNRCNP